MKKLAKWLEKSRFAYDPKSKSAIANNPSVAYQGITQVILLCFPRYVLQTFVEYLQDLQEAWEAKKRSINNRLDELTDEQLVFLEIKDDKARTEEEYLEKA